MANDSLSFVVREYPDCQILRLEALTYQLQALAGMVKSPVHHEDGFSALSPAHKDEAKEVGRNIEDLLKLEPSLRRRFEFTILNCLGTLALGLGTKEAAKKPVFILRNYSNYTEQQVIPLEFTSQRPILLV
jgi:hypothetical protein